MTPAPVGGISGWVIDVIARVGELGVGALIALENIVPPIPSEVILPFAGFSASRGELNGPLAWAAATVGALLGAYVLYAVGALVSYERLHQLASRRWFILFSVRDLERGEHAFARHGAVMVLVGRCIPLVRSVISVPAGLSRMPLWRFTALTAVGSGVWNAIFIYAGYQLGARYDQVQQWLQPISYAVVGALGVGLVWLAVRRVRRAPSQGQLRQ